MPVHLTQRSSCTVLDYEVINHIKLTKIRTTSIRFELWQIAKPGISSCTCVRVAILCIAFLILLRCWHSTCQNLLRVSTTMHGQTYQEYLLTTVVSHRAAPVHETSRVGWFTPWVAVHLYAAFTIHHLCCYYPQKQTGTTAGLGNEEVNFKGSLMPHMYRHARVYLYRYVYHLLYWSVVKVFAWRGKRWNGKSFQN